MKSYNIFREVINYIINKIRLCLNKSLIAWRNFWRQECSAIYILHALSINHFIKFYTEEKQIVTKVNIDVQFSFNPHVQIYVLHAMSVDGKSNTNTLARVTHNVCCRIMPSFPNFCQQTLLVTIASMLVNHGNLSYIYVQYLVPWQYFNLFLSEGIIHPKSSLIHSFIKK